MLFVPKATARRSWQPSMTAGQPVPKVSVLTEETAEIAVAETATFMVALLRGPQCVSRASQVHHVGKSAVPTFQPVHARECRIGHDGDIGGHRRRIIASCPR